MDKIDAEIARQLGGNSIETTTDSSQPIQVITPLVAKVVSIDSRKIKERKTAFSPFGN